MVILRATSHVPTLRAKCDDQRRLMCLGVLWQILGGTGTVYVEWERSVWELTCFKVIRLFLTTITTIHSITYYSN